MTEINSFQKAQLTLRYWLLAKEYYTAVKAMQFAKELHTGLRKDKKTPAFYHQISIVQYLRTIYKSLLFPEMSMTVGFTHDSMEDYDLDIQLMTNRFGLQAATETWILTKKQKGLEKNNDTYYKEIAESPVASIVKPADRMHNVQTMVGVFSAQKRAEYIEETHQYVLPMLKKAKRSFPEQETAYENEKHILLSQIELIEHIPASRNH
jgi:(p)ppGpp synthase/HD superfamily hydrolase